MTTALPSKYGTQLTGSDWAGLPLRIGHIPEVGCIENLSTDTDAVLVWSGGPSVVTICYQEPATSRSANHCFERVSGMMDLLPRGTQLHRVEWQGKPSVCTSVNFPETTLQALSASPGGLVPERGPQFGLVDGHVVDLVSRLQAQAEGSDYLGAVYVQSLSLTLASYVSARYGAQARQVTGRPGRLSSVQRHRIEAFIDNELASNFGLVDLAGLIGYSPDHFARLFKHAFKQSPYQYVLGRRIERAKAMLRDDALPIAQIAAACGFSNQGHLTTQFKHRTGMTPGAYRKT